MGLFSKPSSPTPTTTTQKPKRILIVEDEKVLSDNLAEKLTTSGFEIAQAANGQIGLDMAISFNPDIILLDIMMPILDGKTMLHRLRELPQFKKLPVIVLTNAGNSDNVRDMQLYYNVNDFLIKANVSLETVVNKINSLLVTKS